MKKRIISILLTVCMVLCLVPTGVFAEETGNGTDAGKAIQLGTGGISGYDSTDGYDYIYFGNWTSQDEYTTSGPIKWRVLDDQTNTGETGLFLLSDALLGTGKYGGVYFDREYHRYNDENHRGTAPADDNHENCVPSSAWQGSLAQAWCKDFAGEAGAAENVPDAFTAAELGAILATTKSDGEFTTTKTESTPLGSYFSAAENILNGDRVFFLSAEEAETAALGFTDSAARVAYYGANAKDWWLRSPYETDDVGKVYEALSGRGEIRCVQPNQSIAARPAFNLDLNAVLFTSAAENGKPDGAVDSTLTAVPAYTGNEWKLTLLDNSRSFTASAGSNTTQKEAYSNWSIDVAYSGAKTGTNEYVSAMLVNSAGEVLYYGRIANNSESGTASVTIPAGLAEGTYTLKVFNEQFGGDYKTDYTSDFADVTLTVEAAAEVAIDEINFPDAKFRTVASGYDKDLSGTLSPEEIAEVIWIDCAKQGIESMQGIEFFSALERLYCFKNSLTSLDVSRNTALKMLYCSDNSLTTLDVSSNTALKVLECYNNNLTSLNVSSNTALEFLSCYNNSLTSLDVSGNTALELLRCFENSLTSLDVSGNTALKELYCYDNSLTSLNIGSLPALETVYCYNNELTSLDAGGATALKELQCYENSLTSLNVSGATALVKLDCAFNSLTALDVSSNTALENLQCCDNSGMTTLDVSHNTALKELNCGCNSLTTLDIRNNTALERLWCQENNLTTLDVSNNTALTLLYCWENNLTSLDVSGLSLGTWDFYAEGNVYNVRAAVGTGRTFDLSTLPGNFDVSKASDWNGGTVDGTTLTIDEGVYTVTYTYDCGEGKTEVFSLTTLQEITSIEATVTPPVNGEKPADSAAVVTAPENAAEFRSLSWEKIAEEDYTGQYWFDTWTPMGDNETFQDGYYYRVKLYFDAEEGFGFFKNVIGTVNGRDHDDIYHDVYDYADSSYAYLCTVYTQLHTHEAGDEYAYDENSHWKECTECGAALTAKTAHTPDHEGHATEEYAIKCTECGYEIEAQLSHTHSLTPVPAVAATCTTDGNKAYYVCTCGMWFEDATASVEITDHDSVVIPASGHDWKAATCTEPKTCNNCGETEGTALGHDYATVWSSDADGHWHECSRCHDKKDEADHTPDREEATETEPIKCTECGYIITPALGHTHNLTKVEAKAATCTEDGNIEYYTCDGCDKLFADATGSVEITAAETVVEATGHDYQWVIDKEATATEAGSKHEECIVCHDKKAAVEISATGTTPDYKIIEGANGAWTQNSDGTLTFRANGDFSNFVGVKVDGVLIDASNYTAVSGSTVITLKADYLQTLSVGAHTLTVVYPDGECSTNFEIKTSQSQDTGAASPQTGDNSHLALWIALLFVSGAGVAGTTVYSRKKKYSAK